MRKTVRLVSTLVILTSAAWLSGCSNKTTKEMASATAAPAADPAVIEQGKQIALSRKKGNCLACHMIEDQPLPGNIGPPLIAMKARYPDKAKLRSQIWDATAVNPDSAMVPFGKYKVLTDAEIDKVVEYIWTL